MTRLHSSQIRPQARKQRTWLLVGALYGTFLWRTPYSLKSLPLYGLDWLAPTIGLGIWLLGRWRRRADWPRTVADGPLLAWLAAVSLSTLFSTDLRTGLYGAWEALIWALLLWLLVDANRCGRQALLWQVTYLVGGVVCLIGAAELLAWYFGWPLLPVFQQGWPAIGGTGLLPPTWHRLGLALGNVTALSAYMALLIPPAICFLAATRRQETRLALLFWLTAAAGVLFLSLSRGGFLALGVSLPFLLVGATRSPAVRRRFFWAAGGGRRRSLGLLLVVIPGVIGLGAVGVVGAARLAEHGSGDAVRIDLWRSALEMVRQDPLTGVGPAAFGRELRIYRQPLLARDHITTAHNLYLNVAAEMGLPGLLALVWLLGVLARSWWRRWRTLVPGRPEWWRHLGIGAALAGLAAQFLVDTFVEPAVLLPAAFLVAQVLEPVSPENRAGARPRRRLWMGALAILTLAGAGLAWDMGGYVRFAQGLAWTRRNEVARALSAVEQARQHDPGMGLYSCHAGYLYGLQAAGKWEGALGTALERYRECLDPLPVPGWLDSLNRSALLWQAGKGAEARTLIRQTTAQTPLEWLPWFNRGLWAEQSGDQQEAVMAYGWVLALDPELAGSPFWQQEGRSDRWDEILAAGEQSLELMGGDRVGWRWQTLVASGRWEQAAQEIENGLADRPDDPLAMTWLGEAKLGLGSLPEALAWLDRAVEAAPSMAQPYLVRGEAGLALGRLEEAERDLRIALFLEPTPRAHLGLARLAWKKGEEQLARQEYARALHPLVLPQGYYRVLYHRLSWPGLLPQVARIGYRQDGEAALEWGRLLEQQGDLQAARQVYAAVLEMDPYLAEVRARLAEGDRP